MSTFKRRAYAPFFSGSLAGIVFEQVEAPPQSTWMRKKSTFDVGFELGSVSVIASGLCGGGLHASCCVTTFPLPSRSPTSMQWCARSLLLQAYKRRTLANRVKPGAAY